MKQPAKKKKIPLKRKGTKSKADKLLERRLDKKGKLIKKSKSRLA